MWLQEEDSHLLLLVTSFLLADARTTERTFELLNDEGAFPKLIELVQTPKQDGEANLHRLLMELLYEMSRIQKISLADLGKSNGFTFRIYLLITRGAGCVSDDFVQCLFEIIEQVSHDVSDPYHYPVIRVLVSSNLHMMIRKADGSSW
jgi:hypothetical protein